jgi:methylenetetrahydrofolate dehydrogenase (NADP+)/methenyltetrahydrofolate cyclohydrolase/formyltetrahydrofolate synthetase
MVPSDAEQSTFNQVHFQSPVPSDIEICHGVKPRPVTQIAQQIGLQYDEIELHGTHKAKVNAAAVLARLGKDTPNARYVVVTGRRHFSLRHSSPLY